MSDNLDPSRFANKIPEQVRRAAEEAEALIKANAPPRGANGGGANGGPEGEHPAEQENQTPEEPKTEEHPPLPQESPQPTHPEPPRDAPLSLPPDTRPDAEREAEAWQQRFRTLQGKYDAELPRLQQEIQGLRRVLAEMQTAPAHQTAQQAAQQGAPTGAQNGVPQEVIEEYGQDFVDVMRRTARAEVSEELNALRQQLAQLQGGQQHVVGDITRNRLEMQLSADPQIGPIWQQIDHDLRFHAWLAQEDQFAGASRMALFHDAAARGDADRVGRFFRAFLSEHTATRAPALEPAQTPAPAPNGANGSGAARRPSLEDMAAPGRASGSGAASGGANAEKRVWTRPQIARFYDDVTRGKYKGKEAELRRIEEDIVNASNEGRVLQPQ